MRKREAEQITRTLSLNNSMPFALEYNQNRQQLMVLTVKLTSQNCCRVGGTGRRLVGRRGFVDCIPYFVRIQLMPQHSNEMELLYLCMHTYLRSTQQQQLAHGNALNIL